MWIPDERKVITSRDVKFLGDFESTDTEEEPFFNHNPLEGNDYVSVETIQTEKNEVPQEGEPDSHTPSVDSHIPPVDQVEEKQGTDIEHKRGKGRPKIIRTGKRGRPQKQYKHVLETEPRSQSIENETELEDETANQINFDRINKEIINDPETLSQALRGPNANEWKEAAKNEFEAHIKSETWDIVDRPENKSVIGSRMILKTKYKSNGEIEKRKARLVAKGFAQLPGIDFHETFAPVARTSSIRLMMALAAKRGLMVHQMDVVTAYLNGEVDEEVFMEIPEGLEEALRDSMVNNKNKSEKKIQETSKKWLRELKSKKGKVCKIKKALYGLKQSGRQWYKRLDLELRKIGLKPLNADPCIYTSNEGDEKSTIVAIYVDDIIIATNDENWMNEIKSKLTRNFEMKDLGEIHYCLGIEFNQSKINGTITMSQRKYTETLLEKFGMTDCKQTSTPLDGNQKLKMPDEKEKSNDNEFPYQNLIGSLMYLATSTRPDITYAVNSLSQFNVSHGKEHWQAAKRVLRYLKGTRNYGLVFDSTKEEELTGLVDADWAGCLDDRRSYTGYMFKLGGAAISWEAKKQRTVALSSTEAEYMALSEGTKEAIYLQGFLKEAGSNQKTVTIYNDNQGCQLLAKNPVFHARTKHIDVRHHFVRDAVETKRVVLKYLPTSDMTADIMTKSLFEPAHRKCTEGLGLCDVGDFRSGDTSSRGSVGY